MTTRTTRLFPLLATALACTSSGSGGSPDAGLAPDAAIAAADASVDATGTPGPRVTQVFVRERIQVADAERVRIGLAFGDDDTIDVASDDRQVDRAVSLGGELWIVLDSELDPSTLEDVGGPALRSGAIDISCDGVSSTVASDRARYYSVPGQTVFEDIVTRGPAIHLPSVFLRTGAVCTLVLTGVTSPDGIAPCAPQGEACVSGDTSAVTFSSEALAFQASHPADSSVGVGESVVGLFQFNTHVDAASTGAFSLSTGGMSVPVTTTVNTDDPTIVSMEPLAALDPATTYQMRVTGPDPGGVRDELGGALPEDITITFVTATGLGTCDPVTQQGCLPGEKCAGLSEGPGLRRTACVPNGDILPGQPCMAGPDGADTGFDNCQAEQGVQGYECNGVCTEVCNTTPSNTCSAGVCQIFTGLFTDVGAGNTTGMCRASCDAVAQDCESATDACYYNAGAGDGICGDVAAGAEGSTQGAACVGPSADTCFLNGCAKGYGDWLPKTDGTPGQLCAFFCTAESIHDGNTAGAAGPTAPGPGEKSCDQTVTPGAPGVGDAFQCRNLATFYNFGDGAPQVPAGLGFCVPKADHGDCTLMPFDQCVIDADATAESCKEVTRVIICNLTFGCLSKADLAQVSPFFPADSAALDAICGT